MNIIRFVINEHGDTGQYAFNKELFRYLVQVLVTSPTGFASINLYFQTQGELYTHDLIQLTVASPYKSAIIEKLINDLSKEGNTTIRTTPPSTEPGLYKHISAIAYTAST